jgi:hypothetical protein
MTGQSPTGQGPPSHLDLLAAAADLRRAAVVDDLTGVHRELSRLRSDLVRHLQGERGELAALPGAMPVVVRDGHQRLLRLLNDVIMNENNDVAECTCLVRSAEIEVALRRQAMLETAVFGHSRAADQRQLNPDPDMTG